MAEPVHDAAENEYEREDGTVARYGGVTGKGFLPGQSGNPEGKQAPPGIKKWIEDHTNGLKEMLELYIKVMRGEKLDKKDKWIPGPKDRLEAATLLLDRAIGKPKQTVEETGDDTSKQVLATMQQLLKTGNTDDTGDAPVAPEGKNISAIDAMKRKGSG